MIDRLEITQGLNTTLQMIDQQITSVSREAERIGCRPHELKTPQGDFVLTPLLLARAQCLTTLGQLELMSLNKS